MSTLDSAFTKVLMHFNGSDNGWLFVDESGKNWQSFGDAHIHQGEKKFGNASGSFGSLSQTGNLHGNLGADVIGTGDFLIDYWIYYTSFFNYITVFSTTRGGGGFNIGSDADAKLVWYSSGARQLESASGVFSFNTWHYVEYARTGTALKGYVDTIEKASAVNSEDFSQAAAYIGALNGNDEYFKGYIDEFRIKIGSSVRSGSLPTREYGLHPCYLHTRRDRMNIRGVSTQNQLA